MINFFVGKSQPYFTVQDHLRNAFRQHLSTLSANDKAYRFLLRETTEALRELLSVPSGSQIIFCASTAEIRDRIANDLTSSGALIVDSGYESRQLADAFSRGKIGTQLVEANTRDVLSGHDRYDLLAFAANERYEGIVVSPPDATPSALIVSDISSCAPYSSIDFTRTNSVFFSFAEGFGIPVGMSAWIVDERCLARAGHTDSSNFNSLKRMAEYARQDRSYYDLPAVELYLANGVIRDLLRRSLTTIRRETDYKAALFYHLLENHRTVKPSVATATVRSRTTMVAEAGKAKSQIVLDLEKRGFYPGQLDDPADSRLIFANYPTHSKEQYELLVDALEVTGG